MVILATTVIAQQWPQIQQEAQLLQKLAWNDLQISFNVIKSGTNQKLVYEFLLVVYSNSCHITHRLWEIWRETI